MNKRPEDPVELVIYDALVYSKSDFSNDPRLTGGLDFIVWPMLREPFYIECKQFHSPRISEQMARHSDVIAIQGIGAANAFASIIQRAAK